MELDMTKGSPLRLIMKFMIPLIIGNIFQQFYNMVDTIIVGQYVGVDALAAVGATGSIVFLIVGFLQGITTGFTVITSQRYGAGDIDGVKKSVGNAIVLTAIVTVVGTIVSVFGMDALLRVMNTPSDIFAMSKEYILIICYGLCFNIMYNLLASILRAVGNSKAPLYALIVAVIVNVILDLIFIVNFKMGVAGAAWATIIAQGIAGFLCLFYIIKGIPILHIKKDDLKLDSYCVKNQLSIGIPMALQFSITAIGTILVQSALNILGSFAVAAYTAACKVEQLVTQVFWAIGVTVATFTAQNRGVNDLERIKKGVRIGNVISAIYAVAVGILICNTMQYVIHLFVKDNVESILDYAQIYIVSCSIFFIPLGMIYIYRNMLQGAGFAFIPMFGGVVELVCRAVVAYVAAYNQSFLGVCLANGITWLITGVFLWISYHVIMRRWEARQLASGLSITGKNLLE